MIVYIDSTGKIVGGCAGQSPEDLKGITRLPIENGYAVFIDEVKYPNVANNLGEYVIKDITPAEVYYVPTATGIPVYTPIPDSVKLTSAQEAKKAEIFQKYNETLTAGFTSSATGVPHTFGYGETDQMKFMKAMLSVNAGIATYPIPVPDINNVIVPHDQTQFLQLVKDINTFEWTQQNKLHTLLEQVMSATTVADVNKIVW